MKKTLLIITLILAQFTFSQDFKFGKVSKAELEETQHALEPNANAAVLYRNQDISFKYLQEEGFVQYNVIHERIKIYNKDGYDYATKTIKLYDEGNDTRDKLINFKAYTYNVKDGKIEESKLKKDGIFEEKTNRYWRKTKFTMPNINDGCIIEYKYTVISPFKSIDDIAFQKLIPINKFDFKVATPEYYIYKVLSNLRATYIPKFVNKKSINNVTISYREEASPGLNGTSRSKLVTYNQDVLFNIIESNEENIPALKDEVFVDNLSNYQARLIMELSAVDYPNQVIKRYSNSWKDVAKTIYRNEDFGGQLNKTSYFKKDVNAIIDGLSTSEEKIDAIYNYVKSKVKSNGIIGYYTDFGVSKAYKDGVGNVADINLMLIAMLRYAGLQANPVLVSTKSNGIPITATKNGFNYVIAAVELTDQVVLLDASSAYATANVLPKHLLNWQGRLIRENDSSTWINLQAQESAKHINYLNATINQDLTIIGKVRERVTNHLALSHRQKYNGKNKEVIISAIEDGKGDIEINNIAIQGGNELNKPILISYEYNLQNEIEEIADKLYFSSLLFYTPEENPFKQENREYPIDFTYPVSEKYVINIKIPQGYQVETLPENVKAQFNNNDGSFTYLINQTNDVINIRSNLDLNKTVVLPQDYLEFKQFYDLAIKKQAEQIVLKKG